MARGRGWLIQERSPGLRGTHTCLSAGPWDTASPGGEGASGTAPDTLACDHPRVLGQVGVPDTC